MALMTEFIESELLADVANLRFQRLQWFMDDLAAEIKKYAQQGASDQEWTDAQAMCVVEEAGEFIGAYRRWRGFARRPGELEDVTSELADVIIASFIMFANLPGEAQHSIKQKLSKVVTRGYVNKDPDSPSAA